MTEMKCPKCGSAELRTDAQARWDAEKGAWVIIAEHWLMGAFIWCAECEAEFPAPAPPDGETPHD
jgi:ribosomal protein L40E